MDPPNSTHVCRLEGCWHSKSSPTISILKKQSLIGLYLTFSTKNYFRHSISLLKKQRLFGVFLDFPSLSISFKSTNWCIDINFQVEHCSNGNADNVNDSWNSFGIDHDMLYQNAHAFFKHDIPVTIRQTILLIVWNWYCCAWYFSLTNFVSVFA